MAKFYGEIGFVESVETKPGVWKPQITEKTYIGDLIQNIRRFQGSGVNDDLVMSNKISIISDSYANKNFNIIRYVKFMGSKWKVDSVEVNYPRLILTIGGIYNVE